MTTRPGYLWNGTEWVPLWQETVIAPVKYQDSAPTSPSTGDIWIDSDDTVPSVDSTLAYRWKKTAAGGETSLSNADDSGLSLTYTPGYEQVYINGVLQVRGSDYLATTGNTLTGLTALSAGDIVTVISLVAYSIGDAYTKAAADSIFVQTTQPGNVIETLASVCDGSVKTVKSGIYTFPNVTAQQSTSTTYTDITGSSITYTPPAGTTSVIYKFQFSTYWISTHAINHYKFFIDGAEVVYARHSRSSQYNEDRYSFEWVVNIGGTTSANTGRQATWTTPKVLKMQARNYGGSNNNNLHGTRYWDGGESNQFSMPVLTIEAVA
jgi:hypothetical protein